MQRLIASGSRRQRLVQAAMLLTGTLLSIAAGTAGTPPPTESSLVGIASQPLEKVAQKRPDAAQVRKQLADLNVPFVQNQHSYDAAVAYWAPVSNGQVYVTQDGGLVYQFLGDNSAERVLHERLVNTRSETLKPQGTQPAKARVSRFIGDDSSRWDAAAASYNELALGEAWPGVNVQLRARSQSVEKLFTVAPGADARNIRIEVEGAAKALAVKPDGSLQVATASGDIGFSAPIAWQPAANGLPQRAVEVAYALDDQQHYGFTVGDYDRSRPLVIDPLVRSTYLGGSAAEQSDTDVAFGPGGTIYVAGATTSFNFPGISGPQIAHAVNPVNDIFVAQLSGDLSMIIAASYIGGTGNDIAYSLAVRGTDLYIAGRTTNNTGFPMLTGGAQSVGGGVDGVIMRMPTALNAFTQATLFGGDGIDIIRAMRIASNGDVYVAGDTSFGTSLPGTVGSAQPTRGDSQANIDECNNVGQFCNVGDVFVARFNSTLTILRQASYFGGSAQEITRSGLAISPITGDVYVGGLTQSLDIPGTVGGAQPTNGNPTGDPNTFLETTDVFIGRFSANLKTRFQSTYFGGSTTDGLRELLVNPTTGDLYACGQSGSADLPGLAGGAQPAIGPLPTDPWVSRLSSTLTSVLQTTFVGGSGIARDLAFSPVNGDLYVAGDTTGAGFNGTAGGAYNLINFSGNPGPTEALVGDLFVSRLSPDLTLLRQSTYFGGSGSEGITSVGAGDLLIEAGTGDVLLTGATPSTDLPLTAGAAQPANAGGVDAFVARFDANLSGPDTIANPFSIPTLGGVAASTLVTSAPITVSGIAAPAAISVFDGSYSIDGGAFTSISGAVSNGSQVRVQHTSSSTVPGAVVSRLLIGGQSATFTSNTGDDVPDAFSFKARKDVALGAAVASKAITVSGITVPSAISVSGDPSSQYQINGGAFTSAPGTVVNGNQVIVRHTASSLGNTQVNSVVTIGGISAQFRSTTVTVTGDSNPDPFSFPSQTNLKVNTVATSSVITPVGYGAPATITVSAGGEYRIGGSGYTSAAGTINPGQTVQVRTTTASTALTTTTTTLTIGTTAGTFSTTTR